MKMECNNYASIKLEVKYQKCILKYEEDEKKKDIIKDKLISN
jgi:hypothetical protein